MVSLYVLDVKAGKFSTALQLDGPTEADTPTNIISVALLWPREVRFAVEEHLGKELGTPK